MKASVTDLRYKMKDILKALDKNEEVTLLYHGKVKGIIVPAKRKQNKQITEHPFFGMLSDDTEKSVSETLKDLRTSRCDDF